MYSWTDQNPAHSSALPSIQAILEALGTHVIQKLWYHSFASCIQWSQLIICSHHLNRTGTNYTLTWNSCQFKPKLQVLSTVENKKKTKESCNNGKKYPMKSQILELSAVQLHSSITLQSYSIYLQPKLRFSKAKTVRLKYHWRVSNVQIN